MRGEHRRCAVLVRGCATGAALYFGVVVAVSLVLPGRVLRVGEPLCFDDWCITVEGAAREASQAEARVVVSLRFSSRARRTMQRERNLFVYLRDDRGLRHDPVAEAAVIPTDILLEPLQSVTTTRSFRLPRDAAVQGLAIAHEGGFPIGWFVLGEGPFRKETLVRLDLKSGA